MDLRHLQKMVAGACMIIAPLCWLLGVIISPSESDKEAKQLSSIAGHPDRYYVGTLLFFLGSILLMVAVLGLVHLLHERRPGWGLVGGTMTLLGMVTIVGVLLGSSLMQREMVSGKLDRGQMVSLLHDFNNSGHVVPFFILTIGVSLGMLVLAVGLYRARAVPVGSAGMLGVAAVVFFFLFMAGGGKTYPIIAFLVLTAALGSIGMLVLGESDTEWEHTPEHREFMPAFGAR